MILFISGAEIFIVLLLILLLFGADKIPEFARSFGKGMKEIRNATNDIKREINKEIDTSDSQIQESTTYLKKEIKESSKKIEELTKSIKRGSS